MKRFSKIFASILLAFVVVFGFCACSLQVTKESAYQVAVENGYEGTVDEWLESLKGESAYQIAVRNGFDGSEAQWLESLKGDDGEDGKDGQNGSDGKDGKDGTNGNNGTDANLLELYQFGVESGYYDNTSSGFKLFLQDCLSEQQNEIVQQYVLSLQTERIATIGAKCLNQVVGVYCPVSSSSGSFQTGAGVVYQINANDAYVITNYHVVAMQPTSGDTTVFAPSGEIHLFLYGTESFSKDSSTGEIVYGPADIQANYVGGSAKFDLALLKVSGENLAKFKSLGARAATFAESTNNIQLGTTAIAIGNPLGEGTSLTAGVVSIESEYVEVKIAGVERSLRCLRTDAAINKGNSGGALFDGEGKLIGITNAKYTTSEVDNIANALPASDVSAVIENILFWHNLAEQNTLIEDKTVGVHSYKIGVTYIKNGANPTNTFDEQHSTNTLKSQILVVEVASGSVASAWGIDVGDVIVGAKILRNGNTLESNKEVFEFNQAYELPQMMLTLRPGDKLQIVFVHENQTFTTTEHEIEDEGFVVYKNNDET